METIEYETPYGAPRDETAGVPQGMEAFGPVVIAAPLSRAEAEVVAAQTLRRLAKTARRR